MKKEILICIVNNNSNQNAIELKNNFSNYFDTIIIDSGSENQSDEFDIKLENVYYSGLFNESVNQCILKNKEYVFLIASDVYIEQYDKIVEIINSLEDDIYLWTPSSRGQSHQHCKNSESGGIREVPYLEGFCFLANIKCLDNLYPVSLEKNLYGFGIDLILGYNCIKRLRKKCVVDDRLEIYHKEGTGYNSVKAVQDMYKWVLTDFDNDVKQYFMLYTNLSRNGSPNYKMMLNYLKK
jgi:hypothetical protein